MDFATRDRYRHVVETHRAGAAALSEAEVARKRRRARAAAAARRDGGRRRDARTSATTWSTTACRSSSARRGVRRRVRACAARDRRARVPLPSYLGAIVADHALLARAGCCAHAPGATALDGWLLALLGVLALIAASQLAVALVNWLATLLVAPRAAAAHGLLARAFRRDARTLVVVPTHARRAPRTSTTLVEALEVRFLANRDAHLHFAPADRFPRRAAARRCRTTTRCSQRARARHRGAEREVRAPRPRRRLLPVPPAAPLERRASGVWMGYERKRGKLAELNALLRGGARRSLLADRRRHRRCCAACATSSRSTPTRSCRATRRASWSATMAHPLNRPRFDAERAPRGRGLRHPAAARRQRACRARTRSRYARLFGGEPGIDPYTRAVSDVYQDLFGEGSFIGKGIYDVDAFERALGGRFPENRILSHDLLEGCYARSGLLSDVELLRGLSRRATAPTSSRRHRWIRGDWQIAALAAAARARRATARATRNPLSALSRWKIFDNLRRSLVPAALLAAAAARLDCCRRRRGSGRCAVLGDRARCRRCCAALRRAARASRDDLPLAPAPARVARTRRRAQLGAGRCSRWPACRTRRSSASTRSCARCWRMLVTRRRLLRMDAVERRRARRAHGLAGSVLRDDVDRAGARAGDRGAAAGACNAGRAAGRRAAPAAVARLAGARLVAQPAARARRAARSTRDAARASCARLARRTWRSSRPSSAPRTTGCRPTTSRSTRRAVVAHRTSPTNIGLALLANLAAYDFGYLHRRRADRAHRATRSRRWSGWSATAATSTTGTTRRRCSRCAPLLRLDGRQRQPGRPPADAARRACSSWPTQPIARPRAVRRACATRCGVLRESPADAGRPRDGVARCATLLRRAALRAAGDAAAAVPTAARGADARARATPIVAALAPTRERAAALGRRAGSAVPRARRRTAASSRRGWRAGAGRSRAARARRRIPTLRELRRLRVDAAPASTGAAPSARAERTLTPLVRRARRAPRSASTAIERAGARGARAAPTWTTSFLYDTTRHLLAIGYNVDRPPPRRQLLRPARLRGAARPASSRIAQGQLPQEHWFALGRLLTTPAASRCCCPGAARCSST